MFKNSSNWSYVITIKVFVLISFSTNFSPGNPWIRTRVGKWEFFFLLYVCVCVFVCVFFIIIFCFCKNHCKSQTLFKVFWRINNFLTHQTVWVFITSLLMYFISCFVFTLCACNWFLEKKKKNLKNIVWSF